MRATGIRINALLVIIVLCALVTIVLADFATTTPAAKTGPTTVKEDQAMLAFIKQMLNLKCPSCKDVEGAPQARLITVMDDDKYKLTSILYYENVSKDPPRVGLGEHILIIQAYSSDGAIKETWKVYTNGDKAKGTEGEAVFDFSKYYEPDSGGKPTKNSDKPLAFRILYCPFTCDDDAPCGFQECLKYAGITPKPAANTVENIPAAQSLKYPKPAEVKCSRYLPTVANAGFTPPPPPKKLTPSFCWPLLLIFALLGGGLYMTGRNPFAGFDFSAPRLGRHIRYAARGRGLSVSAPTFVQAYIQGAAKGALGEAISEGASTAAGLAGKAAGVKGGGKQQAKEVKQFMEGKTRIGGLIGMIAGKAVEMPGAAVKKQVKGSFTEKVHAAGMEALKQGIRGYASFGIGSVTIGQKNTQTGRWEVAPIAEFKGMLSSLKETKAVYNALTKMAGSPIHVQQRTAIEMARMDRDSAHAEQRKKDGEKFSDGFTIKGRGKDGSITVRFTVMEKGKKVVKEGRVTDLAEGSLRKGKITGNIKIGGTTLHLKDDVVTGFTTKNGVSYHKKESGEFSAISVAKPPATITFSGEKLNVIQTSGNTFNLAADKEGTRIVGSAIVGSNGKVVVTDASGREVRGGEIVQAAQAIGKNTTILTMNAREMLAVTQPVTSNIIAIKTDLNDNIVRETRKFDAALGQPVTIRDNNVFGLTKDSYEITIPKNGKDSLGTTLKVVDGKYESVTDNATGKAVPATRNEYGAEVLVFGGKKFEKGSDATALREQQQEFTARYDRYTETTAKLKDEYLVGLGQIVLAARPDASAAILSDAARTVNEINMWVSGEAQKEGQRTGTISEGTGAILKAVVIDVGELQGLSRSEMKAQTEQAISATAQALYAQKLESNAMGIASEHTEVQVSTAKTMLSLGSQLVNMDERQARAELGARLAAENLGMSRVEIEARVGPAMTYFEDAKKIAAAHVESTNQAMGNAEAYLQIRMGNERKMDALMIGSLMADPYLGGRREQLMRSEGAQGVQRFESGLNETIREVARNYSPEQLMGGESQERMQQQFLGQLAVAFAERQLGGDKSNLFGLNAQQMAVGQLVSMIGNEPGGGSALSRLGSESNANVLAQEYKGASADMERIRLASDSMSTLMSVGMTHGNAMPNEVYRQASEAMAHFANEERNADSAKRGVEENLGIRLLRTASQNAATYGTLLGAGEKEFGKVAISAEIYHNGMEAKDKPATVGEMQQDYKKNYEQAGLDFEDYKKAYEMGQQTHQYGTVKEKPSAADVERMEFAQTVDAVDRLREVALQEAKAPTPTYEQAAKESRYEALEGEVRREKTAEEGRRREEDIRKMAEPTVETPADTAKRQQEAREAAERAQRAEDLRGMAEPAEEPETTAEVKKQRKTKGKTETSGEKEG